MHYNSCRLPGRILILRDSVFKKISPGSPIAMKISSFVLIEMFLSILSGKGIKLKSSCIKS